MRWKNIIGRRFGRLVVKSGPHSMGRYYKYLCKCDCGVSSYVTRGSLSTGNTKSCGCIKAEMLAARSTTHGMAPTGGKGRIYNIWIRMRQRCNDTTCSDYRRYGGRGITVCQEWDDFVKFREWSLSHGYQDSLTVDRVDNDRGYSPENCAWKTIAMQAKNTSRNHRITYKNRTMIIADWCRELSIEGSLLRYRIKKFGPQEAIRKSIDNRGVI